MAAPKSSESEHSRQRTRLFRTLRGNVIAMMVSSGFTGNVGNARDWLTERADSRERREQWTSARDLILDLVIIGLIGWEIRMSYRQERLQTQDFEKQQRVLTNLQISTAETSASLQKLVAAQDASLKILQQEQAEQAKKPRFALYLGNVPIDKASLHLIETAGQAQSMTNFNLTLKNEGDVPASPSEIHVLVPEGIFFALDPLSPVPEFEMPAKPATRTFTYAVRLLPAGKTLRINGSARAPRGHAPFKAIFTVTTPQLQAVMPLGSLTVLPPKL